MYKKQYKFQAIINFVLGGLAILLYLPYTFQAFNINCDKWIKISVDIFKSKYFDVLIWLGLILIIWFMALNILSIFSHCNIPKLVLKLCVVTSLILPLFYVCALKFDWALELWINKIGPNIKTLAYAFICMSIGGFALGLIFNFSKRNKANIHHIVQALVMVVLLVLLAVVMGWCGWEVGSADKLFGVLMGLLAIYLPVSVALLFVCSKRRL